MRAVGAVATSPFLYLTWFGELPGKSCCFQNLNTSCVADVCFLLFELFFILLAKFYASQKMELFPYLLSVPSCNPSFRSKAKSEG